MQKHFGNSVATYPAGIAPGRKLFRVPSGPRAGRVVVLMQLSAVAVSLAWADLPYTGWSALQAVVSDTADGPFDAVMADDGTIFLAYILGSNNDLVLRRLSASDDGWSVGDLITVYNGDDNHFPSICREPSGRLHIAWDRHVSGTDYVNIKYSDNDGDNWYGGPSGVGVTLTAGGSSAYPRMLQAGEYIYVVYTDSGTTLACRRKHYLTTVWESATELDSGTGFSHQFDAVGIDTGVVGVVYVTGGLKFREFDGSTWGGIVSIDDGGDNPQVRYFDGIPHITFLLNSGAGQKNLYLTRREADGFSSPVIVDTACRTFEKAFCYSAGAASFEDKTEASADSTTADIYHSGSSAVLKESGDSLYLGSPHSFHHLKIILSTVGAGGTVGWQYFNGTAWIAFVPSGGAFNFDSADRSLLLWDDLLSVPADWQKTAINGSELFWVRAVVSVAFTSGPVGTMITAVPEITSLILMEA